MRVAVFCLAGLALAGSAGAGIVFRPEAEWEALRQARIANMTPEQRARSPLLKDPKTVNRTKPGEIAEASAPFPTLPEMLARADTVDPLHAILFDNTVYPTDSPSRALIEAKTSCRWQKAKAVGPDADGTGRDYSVFTIYACGDAYLTTAEVDLRTSEQTRTIYDDEMYNDPVGNRFRITQYGWRYDGIVMRQMAWLNADYQMTYELYHPEKTDFDIESLRSVIDAAARQQYAKMAEED